MRINVYAEEIISHDVEIITKSVETNAGTTETFYGIRMYLISPQELHHTADDDDRSAITFWVRWTKKLGNQPGELIYLFETLREAGINIANELGIEK